jgi:hypothetical protein
VARTSAAGHGDRDGRYATALGGHGRQAGLRPRDHDQVGPLRCLRHRLGEEHRKAHLAGEQLSDIVVGGDQTAGDGGEQPPPRRGGLRAREDTPQRGDVPGHGGGVHGARAAENLDRDAERTGSPGKLPDACGGPGQHMRTGTFVRGDVQAAGCAQHGCHLGIGPYAGHRGRTACAGPQDLRALSQLARGLGRGQAARPDQSGDLAQAVANAGYRPNAEEVQGAQCLERHRE